MLFALMYLLITRYRRGNVILHDGFISPRGVNLAAYYNNTGHTDISLLSDVFINQLNTISLCKNSQSSLL